MPTAKWSLVVTRVVGKTGAPSEEYCLSASQYVLGDPYASKRHVRIYSVVYENDEPTEVDTLVYAEDLSQNGTYWNGSFIGKGNGGFLLSDQDVLRLSRRTYFTFSPAPSGQKKPESFDYIQETEMAVRLRRRSELCKLTKAEIPQGLYPE